MHRRSFLAVLAAGGLGGMAGCGTRLTGPIERQRFDICDTDCDWANETPDPGGDPIVERSPDERRIVVYGNMYVGSSSCDKAVLESASVGDDTLRLVVAVGDKDPTMGGCTADMGTDQYRATFHFREELPADVVVEERAAYDPSDTETTDG
jgi:hypothetical protein